MTYPDTYYVEREYDELNRLTAIYLNGDTNAAAQFAYDDLSRRQSLTLENSVVTDYSFQKDDDLESIEHTFNGSSVSFGLDYSDAHEMTDQTVSNAAFMWHPGAGSTTYATAGDTNQYPTVGGVSYSYNNNGCLEDDNVWSFVYDTENHLLSADNGGTPIEFAYDPHHRRGQKKIGSAKTRYIYAGWQRIAEYDQTDSLVCRYVYGSSVDEVLIRVSSGGTKRYYHANHQGSVVALTNASGVVTNTYTYSPFGESGSLSGSSHGFTGQMYDEETGLYCFRHRYYSPKIGRFLQPDPAWSGLNQYTYIKNSGLNGTDPLGLKWVVFGTLVDARFGAYNNIDKVRFDVGDFLAHFKGMSKTMTADTDQELGRIGEEFVKDYLKLKMNPGNILSQVPIIWPPYVPTEIALYGYAKYHGLGVTADFVYPWQGLDSVGEVKSSRSGVPDFVANPDDGGTFSSQTCNQESGYRKIASSQQAYITDRADRRALGLADDELWAGFHPVDFFFLHIKVTSFWVPDLPMVGPSG